MMLGHEITIADGPSVMFSPGVSERQLHTNCDDLSERATLSEEGE